MLSVRNVSKDFTLSGGVLGIRSGIVAALRGVSFDVRKGETFALIGESGSGKTTMARIIARLTPPTSGEVLFNGINEESFRKGVQIVFQNPYASLNPRMRAGDIIAEPLMINRLVKKVSLREKVVSLLKMVEMPSDAAERLPSQLSGGQRQRICIARALATAPKFLILDEPLSSLDLTIQARMLDMLMELKERLGMTYLFITHNLCLVKKTAARVAVMKDGRVVEQGETGRVFSAPQHPYTRQLLSVARG
ncbi:MAG: ATP-binding cassette domain-containing protein [Candidatus Omnitrophota bacterium]|jgi:ABC-type glutathione transport system ATPase component|nr:ATP-binding cassette domain-containing protein [Candidatus Omnitrophota bacterium]